MKRFEFGLRRTVEGKANQVLLSGSDEVPEQFRKLVEQYYRSLSKAPEKAGDKPARQSTGQEVTRIAARSRTRAAGLVALFVIAATALTCAQFQGFRGGRRGLPPRFPPPRASTAASTSAALMYEQVRREDGGQGWWTDYPDADINFSDPAVRADQDPHQPAARRRAEPSRRSR